MHKRIVGEIATNMPSNPDKMFISAMKVTLWKGMNCVQLSLVSINLFFLSPTDFPTLSILLYTESWNSHLRFSTLKR